MNRILKLQHLMRERDLDMVIIDDPTDLYYLTGLHLSSGKLLLKQTEAHLFVDGRYTEAAKQFKNSSLISNEALSKYAEGMKSIAFDSLTTSYASFLQMKKWAKKLQPWEGITQSLRAIKDEDEKEKMRASAKLCAQGFDFVLTILKEGITEKEVATQLELFWKKKGGGPLSFDSIIAFGANSAMPHYRAGNKALSVGDSVLIDIGVALNDYQSDMTRTLFYGKPKPELKKIYEIVKNAQEAALALCKEGALVGDLDKAARDFITSSGYGDKFVHSLGHSLGLVVHEWPTLRQTAPFKNIVIKTDMAITIEPGIYLEGLGGVRIENSILIKKEGYEDLTQRSTDLLIL